MTIALIEEIQASLGLSSEQMVRLIVRSPYTYKTYTIPKKSGGFRVIAQPAKETKLIQRWLISNLFNKLPIHDCATAYKEGSSIKLNANKHRENEFLSKFDFIDFFQSIKEEDIKAHLMECLGGFLSEKEVAWVARLSCIKTQTSKNLCLSVGAPSSPLLSNSAMFQFDSKLNNWCQENGIIYTRYADDLTFSSSIKGASAEIEGAIQNVLTEMARPKLLLNNKKTIHVSKKHQRRITGIIINNEDELSLGRERKRMISALIHKFTLNQLASFEIFRLQGLLGFSKDVEPAFLIRMRDKYGSGVIEMILKIRKDNNGKNGDFNS
ncbi:MAG: RNA-directed DNA polymerase [Alphaproteobacteria bacterium]|nr:MAG: RNA-directed DNA polymerase [Alphaproteobacteria bacterium]